LVLPLYHRTVCQQQTTRLDLSHNELRTLAGVERFVNLRELLLDANQLGDEFEIPSLPRLTTLSLNKNRVRGDHRATSMHTLFSRARVGALCLTSFVTTAVVGCARFFVMDAQRRDSCCFLSVLTIAFLL
jgi:hypothetical protein